MIREEIVHVNGIPKKLIVFLHGYLDNSDAVDARLQELCENISSVAVHIPQAPTPCEVEPHQRQWYSMYRFDPAYERKNAPTMKEFVSYYNRMTLGLEEARSYLLPYIEQTLAEYNLGFDDLFLCGFSQGAMTALYTALMMPQKIAGVVSFSGILAGHEYLLKNAKSEPDVLLLHGTDDKYLRPESVSWTARQLKKIGCHTECCTLKGGGHKVSAEAVSRAIEFIRQKF